MDRIFANTMIYFREKAHLTQSELADRTGLTQSGISKIERGEHWPNRSTVSRFCEGVGISINDFFAYMGIYMVAIATNDVIYPDYGEEED